MKGAAHYLYELLDNAQPQSSSVLYGGIADSDKRNEDPGLIFGSDPAACILYLENQAGLLPGFDFLRIDGQGHSALIRELDGIVDQVQKHPAKLGGIGTNKPGNSR